MDIIIPAIAGALGNLTSDTVKAGYKKLKDLVLRKFGADNKMTKAIEELEQESDSEGRKMLLREAAAKVGADKDAEIIKAAEELLALVKEQPGGEKAVQQVIGNQNIFTNTGTLNFTVNR